MTVSPNSTMLPPIWVAAWDSHRRRNAGIAEDGERTLRLVRPGARSRPRRRRWAPRPRSRALVRPAAAAGVDRPTAAVSAGSPRSTKAANRRSRVGRSMRTCRPQVRQRSPISAPRRSTSHVSPPHGWVRRSRSDVAEQQVQDGSGRHGGQAIRAAGDRDSARGPGPSRGRRPGRAGVTSTMTSGCVAASWAMMPAGSRQRPGELVGGADRATARTGRPSGTPSTVTAPGGADRDHPRDQPDGVDARSPRRRRCAAR